MEKENEEQDTNTVGKYMMRNKDTGRATSERSPKEDNRQRGPDTESENL